MFTTIMYMVFGIQFIITVYLFLRNRKSLKSMPLYEHIHSRISPMWLLLPLAICSLACILFSVCTIYVYSPMELSLILLPLLNIHIACVPSILRQVGKVEDMRDSTFRSMIGLGVRSRVLILAAVSNLILTFYSFMQDSL